MHGRQKLSDVRQRSIFSRDRSLKIEHASRVISSGLLYIRAGSHRASTHLRTAVSVNYQLSRTQEAPQLPIAIVIVLLRLVALVFKIPKTRTDIHPFDDDTRYRISRPQPRSHPFPEYLGSLLLRTDPLKEKTYARLASYCAPATKFSD